MCSLIETYSSRSRQLDQWDFAVYSEVFYNKTPKDDRYVRENQEDARFVWNCDVSEQVRESWRFHLLVDKDEGESPMVFEVYEHNNITKKKKRNASDYLFCT